MDEQRQNEVERISKEAVVMGLARSQGVKEDEVQSLYDSVLAELRQDAVILDFLPIFAARKVKEMLLHGGPPAVPSQGDDSFCPWP